MWQLNLRVWKLHLWNIYEYMWLSLQRNCAVSSASLPDCFLSLSSPTRLCSVKLKAWALPYFKNTYMRSVMLRKKKRKAASMMFWCNDIHCFIHSERFQFCILCWGIKFDFHMSVVFQIRKWTVKNYLIFFPQNWNCPLSHQVHCFCKCPAQLPNQALWEKRVKKEAERIKKYAMCFKYILYLSFFCVPKRSRVSCLNND